MVPKLGKQMERYPERRCQKIGIAHGVSTCSSVAMWGSWSQDGSNFTYIDVTKIAFGGGHLEGDGRVCGC